MICTPLPPPAVKFFPQPENDWVRACSAHSPHCTLMSSSSSSCGWAVLALSCAKVPPSLVLTGDYENACAIKLVRSWLVTNKYGSNQHNISKLGLGFTEVTWSTMSSVWQLIGEETDAVGEGRVRRGGRMGRWTNLRWQLELPDLEKADVAEVRRSSKAKQPRWAHLEIEIRATIMPVGFLFRFPPHTVSHCWQSWWFKRVASWCRGWGEANEAVRLWENLKDNSWNTKKLALVVYYQQQCGGFVNESLQENLKANSWAWLWPSTSPLGGRRRGSDRDWHQER